MCKLLTCVSFTCSIYTYINTYIYTYTYIHIYIYIYIFIYLLKYTHKTEKPSQTIKHIKMDQNQETHFYKKQYFATPYKTFCPSSYYLKGFVATHALGHIHRTLCAQVHELPQSRCGDNCEGTLFS